MLIDNKFNLEDGLYSELISDDIDIKFILLLKNIQEKLEEETSKNVKIIFATCKKVIKSPTPAKGKYYSLLIIVEIMKNPSKEVITAFINKLADRLCMIAKYKEKEYLILKNEQGILNTLAESCLDE